MEINSSWLKSGTIVAGDQAAMRAKDAKDMERRKSFIILHFCLVIFKPNFF